MAKLKDIKKQIKKQDDEVYGEESLAGGSSPVPGEDYDAKNLDQDSLPEDTEDEE